MDNTFGSRLRFVRKKWGLTQTELAERAGVNIATVQRAEWGTFDPRFSTAQKLADALHVRVEWLLTGDSDTMVLLNHLTFDEQMKSRPPAGHPDTVLIVGPGPWFMDEDGEWQVDRAAFGAKPALGRHDN
jgi:transcriptional regulator with XRE-family HTH domain